MYKKIYIIVIILILILGLLYVYFSPNSQYVSIKKKDQWNLSSKGILNLLNDKAPKCVKGCPIIDSTNQIHTLYGDYSDVRALNNKKQQNTIEYNSIGPKNIFIIRHGEKIKSLLGLDCNGIYRSVFIPEIIQKLNKMNYTIDYIITSNPMLTDGLMHEEQTVMLSSWLLNIPLFIFGDCHDTEITIQKIYSNKLFNDKNIFICWEHTCIQSLLYNLLTIGPQTKNIPNQAFLNKSETLALPNWNTNNFQTIIHIDDKFKETIYNSGIKNCNDLDNNKIIFGKYQTCKGFS